MTTTASDREAALLQLNDLHPSLNAPALSAMTFLNEVAERFSGAVSFAAGRPFAGYFDVEDIHRHLRTYCEHLRSERGFGEQQTAAALLQYGHTKGLINDVIARHLQNDEGISVSPDAIVVTAGCQEAMYLTLRALRRDERDVLLAVTPTYVGITGAARLVDMPVLPVADGPDGLDLADLAAVVRQARSRGLRPRACYLVPDFSNPTGVSLSQETRTALLSLAEQEDILLLEDNPYGQFTLDGPRRPTLKSLDTTQRVIYLGSFAKTCFPGARIGYAVADQPVVDPGSGIGCLADHLSKIKSMVTVNTSPITQAIVAGRLLENGYSLVAANQRETAAHRGRLRRLLRGLAERFPEPADGSPAQVRWNTPDGGFFVVVSVPFTATDSLLEHSARVHRVLWTPMHHFYDNAPPMRRLRLSCSALSLEQIDDGLDRLASFIHQHTPREQKESDV
ncbi:PLP-dependent aminotransferase family protein [Streptomyces sp. NPDC057430]|uniref:aminotransferase-like domain-containing protein n=1 Tax=unclassified Streptomyces TaxID=2593676 RepID=UPI0036BA3622